MMSKKIGSRGVCNWGCRCCNAVGVSYTFSGVVFVGVCGNSGPDRRRYVNGVCGFRRKG